MYLIRNIRIYYNIGITVAALFFLFISTNSLAENTEDTPNKNQQQEQIVVKGARQQTIAKVDRNIYVIRNKPEAATLDAQDIISQLPNVFINQQGEIIVQGDKRTSVTINGMPTPRDAALQFPGAMIDRIEVIANPPTNYNSDSRPIINIIVKEGTINSSDNKFNIRANTHYNFNGSLINSYSKNKLKTAYNFNFTSNINQNNNLYNHTQYLNYLNRDYLESEYNSKSQKNLHSLKFFLNGSYALTGKEICSFMVSAKSDYINISNDGVSKKIKDSASFPEVSNILTMQSNKTSSIILLISLHKQKPSKIQNSDAIISDLKESFEQGFTILATNHKISGNQLWITSPSGVSELQQYEFINDIANVQSFKIGYGIERALNNTSTAALGVGSSLTQNTNIYTMLDQKNNIVASDNNVKSSDDFSFVYFALNRKQGPITSLLGLRAEEKYLKFNQNSGANFDKKYSLFNPSAYLSYRFDNNSLMKISAGVKNEYLKHEELNPILVFEDKYNAKRGNPSLSPSKINWVSAELSTRMLKSNINFEIYRREIKNSIDTYTSIEGNNVVIENYFNAGTKYTNGFNIFVEKRYGKLRSSFNYSGYKVSQQSYNLHDSGIVKYYEDNAKMLFDWDISKKEKINLTISHSGAEHGIDWHTSPSLKLDFSYYVKLKNTWSINAEYFNIISGHKTKTYINNKTINSFEASTPYRSGIRLSLAKDY